MRKFIKKGLSLLLVAVLSLSFNLTFALSEQRQNVVNYALRMANISWTPSRDMEHWNFLRGIVFRKGVLYIGIPYSQTFRETDLEGFEELIGEDKTYAGEEVDGHIIPRGSDCSSAVSMAWKQLKPFIPYLSTYDMIPTSSNTYIVKVGNYEVPEKATTSTEIIEANTEEVIYAAYSKLKPGDAVVTRSDRCGHVILVREVDVDNQKIIGIEQTGVDENGVCLGKEGKSTWRDDRILTFEELYSKAYIPITIEELKNLD